MKMLFTPICKGIQDIVGFMQKKDFALVLITVDSYQVVRGIDNVTWWSVSDLETSPDFVNL